MGYSGGGRGRCGGLAGKRLCGSMISIELHRNSVGITLPHGCSPVGLLRLSGRLLAGALLDDCLGMKLYSCITFSVKLLIKSRCK